MSEQIQMLVEETTKGEEQSVHVEESEQDEHPVIAEEHKLQEEVDLSM